MNDNDTHSIEIVISPDGTVDATVLGIFGPGCEGLLENIVEPLGDVVSHKKTREHKLRVGQTVRHLRRQKAR